MRYTRDELEVTKVADLFSRWLNNDSGMNEVNKMFFIWVRGGLVVFKVPEIHWRSLRWT
jgi:hypothetical protein